MNDIAVAMACPVVAIHPERKQWIIYGGGIHFSKDFLTMADGTKCFGRMVHHDEKGWSAKNELQNPFLISLSQEHGVVQCNDETFSLYKPGDLSFWLPVHSCMTADAMGAYVTTDGIPVDHYRQRLNR
jgi:D-serine deaminase-like pyridoxal phosphate-dependent protein